VVKRVFHLSVPDFSVFLYRQIDMRIRQADVDDAAAIARVHVDAWRTTYVGIVPDEYLAGLTYEPREQMWRESLADRARAEFTLVAENDQRAIVGFATGGPEREGNAVYRGELRAIYLLADSRRIGLGRRLVAGVAKGLIEAGFDSMLVWVLDDNPSRRFYEALRGKFVAEKVIEIGGARLIEVAYGWHDIRQLAQGTSAFRG
jgi:L-amino acid N-acyltransferase YncA